MRGRTKDVTVIFVGHGTRSHVGRLEFHQTCNLTAQGILRRLRRMASTGLNLTFERGCLELAEPALLQTLRLESVQRADGVLIVPLFLFEAGHMEHDIPRMMAESGLRHDSSVKVLPAIGVDSRFVQVTVHRVRETGYRDEQPEAVLLLGRGNQSVLAQAAFTQISLAVNQHLSPEYLDTGYLAGTGRDWRGAFEQMVADGHPHIYVQPYLWFHGWLTNQIRTWVNERQTSRWVKRMPRISVGEPLGIHPLIIESMVNRVVAELLEREVLSSDG